MRHFIVYLLDIYFNRNWQLGEAESAAVHAVSSGFGHADYRSDFGKRNILLAEFQNQQNRFLVFDSSGQSVLRCRDALAADMAVSGLMVGVFFTAELARNFWLRTSAAAAAKTAGFGCPFLLGARVWPGFNDLATCYPEIAAEWHPVKNRRRTPDQIYKETSKRAWWVCRKCGHEWYASVQGRTVKGAGCTPCRKTKTYDT